QGEDHHHLLDRTEWDTRILYDRRPAYIPPPAQDPTGTPILHARFVADDIIDSLFDKLLPGDNCAHCPGTASSSVFQVRPCQSPFGLWATIAPGCLPGRPTPGRRPTSFAHPRTTDAHVRIQQQEISGHPWREQ